MGDVLSGLGAVLLLVSLWRPWYELRIPDEVIAQARAFSSRIGELGPFAQQGLDQLQEQGAVPVTAWQVFEQADAMLAVAAGRGARAGGAERGGRAARLARTES